MQLQPVYDAYEHAHTMNHPTLRTLNLRIQCKQRTPKNCAEHSTVNSTQTVNTTLLIIPRLSKSILMQLSATKLL
jgi:DNA-directed RNA polymerase subunit L